MDSRHRDEDRYSVRFQADARAEDGSDEPVRITNLSSWGCRFTVARQAKLGKLVTLAVARIGQVDGQIKWTDGRTYGVHFDDQLPKVWLDHMRLFLSQPPAFVAERKGSKA
jgi:hypothetical protein